MLGTYVAKTWPHDPTLNAPPRYRRACSYDAFIPRPLSELKIELDGEVAGAIAEAEKAIADLNNSSVELLAPLGRLLLRTEAIASSKVEGLRADTRVLGLAEAKLAAGRKAGPEARDVLANIDAMEMAVENASAAPGLTAEDLKQIHRALMETQELKTAGMFRTGQSWIGGNDYNPCDSDFVPPPADHVRELVDDLCMFANADGLSPLTQAAIAHAQFETIHPFDDGNGRTGRALIHIILRRRELAPSYVPPISVVLAKGREDYIRGLIQFREGAVGTWLRKFARAAESAAYLALTYRERVLQLQEVWREQLRAHSDPREDAVAWEIIEALPAFPVVNVAMLMAATRRSRPATANGVEELEAAGVLRLEGGGRWNRRWEAEGLLDLIAGLEAGEA